MGQLGPWLLFLVAASVAGEYAWTGTYWKWQNQEDPSGTTVIGGGVVEGSGDGGYNEKEDDDTYAYEYEEDDYDYSVHEQSDGKLPTEGVTYRLPTFSDGSGVYYGEDEDIASKAKG